jgi:hypothetical protein
MFSLILKRAPTSHPATKKYDDFQGPDAYELVVPDVKPDMDR